MKVFNVLTIYHPPSTHSVCGIEWYTATTDTCMHTHTQQACICIYSVSSYLLCVLFYIYN